MNGDYTDTVSKNGDFIPVLIVSATANPVCRTASPTVAALPDSRLNVVCATRKISGSASDNNVLLR